MRDFSRRWLVLFAFALCILPSVSNGQVYFLRDTFCSNQLVIVNNHLYGPDHPIGTEVLPGMAVNGQDSIIEVRLVFQQPVTVKLEQTLCANDTLWVNNVPYHANHRIGKETIEGGASNGCDSIVLVNLSFIDKIVYNLVQTICEGDTILVNGVVYDAFNLTGTEFIPAGGANGCDSLIQVNLTARPLPFSILTDTLCMDSFRIINGHRYDKNNRTGLEILPNASYTGCDSLLNVQLAFRELWTYLGEDIYGNAGDSICITPLYNFHPTELVWAPAVPCAAPDCILFCQTYFKNAAFRLFARDTSGCVQTDDIRIYIKKNPRVYMPNIFSPDAAWPNNYYNLGASAGVRLIRKMQILSRWGDLVWEKENIHPNVPESGWDGYWNGTTAPPGVYTFWAELEWWDGTPEIVSGSFAMIR